MGADEVFGPNGEGLQDAVETATDGRGVDIAVEAVGGYTDQTAQFAMTVTRSQGRMVVLGKFKVPVSLDWEPARIREQVIVFSYCYGVIHGRHDFEVAIDLMARRNAQLDQLVTHSFALSDIESAFETASNKSTGSIKVQIHT